jgi:hypothetical protein
MQRLSALVEFTRKEIIGGTDPTFIHHKQYTKELPSAGGSHYQSIHKVQVGNSKHYEVIFKTDSHTFPGEDYLQKIILLDLNALVRDKKSDLTFKDKVMYAINSGDLLVGCQCPAFLWWGYAYITTQLGIVHPEFKQTNNGKEIRNPQLRGIVCKHINLALQVLPFNASSITSDLKDILNA